MGISIYLSGFTNWKKFPDVLFENIYIYIANNLTLVLSICLYENWEPKSTERG